MPLVTPAPTPQTTDPGGGSGDPGGGMLRQGCGRGQKCTPNMSGGLNKCDSCPKGKQGRNYCTPGCHDAFGANAGANGGSTTSTTRTACQTEPVCDACAAGQASDCVGWDCGCTRECQPIAMMYTAIQRSCASRAHGAAFCNCAIRVARYWMAQPRRGSTTCRVPTVGDILCWRTLLVLARGCTHTHRGALATCAQ